MTYIHLSAWQSVSSIPLDRPGNPMVADQPHYPVPSVQRLPKRRTIKIPGYSTPARMAPRMAQSVGCHFGKTAASGKQSPAKACTTSPGQLENVIRDGCNAMYSEIF
ncbi:hypothetical protein [Pararhizobium antarcticum]|uniref:hypothetical protein n=1 Tax=Pararhizobium antarcticum TaxID=1798805 RepID=UPI0011148EF2|nr:hypothetical protein [Pararhizobium antarcticum]